MQRRLPQWAELRTFVRPPTLPRDLVASRLARAASIQDLRTLARRRAPRAVFDYTDGGAGDELSLRRSRAAFARVEFQPSVLHDVSSIDTSTAILGISATMPMVFGPTGFTRMMHAQGESAVARAASEAGIPYALSTLGTITPEGLAAEAPDARRWFQLYLFRDRDFSQHLVERAQRHGFEALVLTVDTPIPGPRLRDVRNGLTLPPALRLRTIGEAALHPRWWFDLLTTEPLEFATLRGFDGTVAELVAQVFDPSATIADLDWLRANWQGPLIVKGITTVADAKLVVDAGADAIVVSNHGGRQLDRSPTPLEQLPSVVDAVGDRAEVYVDGGVLSGADVVAGVAMGARAVLVGRAYLYGLMAAGERGVRRAAEILGAEIAGTMALLGVTRVADLRPEHVLLRPHAG